ncbi:MAG TPA: SpoIID/LytB domain-containing protein, partial [Pyrinomonadaceae bacterium]|nr:SpoIID/LytB domain-containing protein [Pyrinomonadaceae bacterium]
MSLNKILRVLLVASIAVGLTLAVTRTLHDAPAKPIHAPEPPKDEDARLQAVAETTLAAREGAVIVLDPQSGRVRAVVNPELAFKSAFPPGSTIKPFTTLGALRAGIIKEDTRIRCRGKHKREDVVDACVHPPRLPPFTPAEAVAYSCNYFFATIGERLEQEKFTNMLTEFGFGQPTGIESPTESAGVLARGSLQLQSALGEGPFVQVTPVQLATAYAALFNGGALLKPNYDGVRKVRAQLRIDDKERSMLLEGMRGAVSFGTAEKADLDSLPVYVIGKTGTSTQLGGFRSQGWFAGIAFKRDPEPANAQLLVVVYLKNAHGSDAAELARPIFEEFAGKRDTNKDTTAISVHQVSENITKRMPLEEYVLQVVASEASVEDQPEALKALAITARTYALKNLGRHKEQGYDFCSTTHCQRFESEVLRPSLAAAVKETAGLVLRSDKDQIVDAYFSASCGGTTANINTLWGGDAPAYLRGVRDDYCNTGAHYRWTDVIDSARLANALRSDPRTDVGQNIRNVSVTRYDQTGRAELVSIAGDRRKIINGWEFKLIVGRALGWNVLKSSRFNASRSGSQFVFRGGGFGHGLGLCQEGSHVMAQRGQSYQQILAHYFPGTTTEPSAVAPGERQSRATSHFRLVHPRTLEPRDAEYVLSLLESTRSDLLRRVSAAGIEPRFPNLEVVVNETTGDFVGRTGLPAWAAAATRRNTVELQPLKLLKQRRILETTVRHELVHVMIDAIGGGQTPRWLTEGMAVYVAGEGRLMESPQQMNSMSPATIEQALAGAKSATDMRNAYAAAYNLVKQLIRSEGEQKVWKRVADRSYSV